MNNTILLYDQIGLGKLDGSVIAQKIYALAETNKVINVRINSLGGSVINGLSIMAAMADVDAKVITYIDGVAASMAGAIAVSGDEVVMKDYALLMMHNTHFGTAKTTEKGNAVIKAFNASLNKIYQNSSKLSTEKLQAMMDAETWINAEDAKSYGLVTRVEATGRTFTDDAKKIAATVSNELLASADAALVATLAENTTNTTTTTKIKPMNEDLLKACGMDVKASTDDVLKAFSTKVDELKALGEVKTELEAKVTELEASIVEKDNAIAKEKALRAEELINSSLEAGRIKTSEKEDWTELALENYDRAAKLLNAIAPLEKLSAIVKGEEEKDTDEDDLYSSPIDRLNASIREGLA